MGNTPHGSFRSMFLDALRTSLGAPEIYSRIEDQLDSRVSTLTTNLPDAVQPWHAESAGVFAAAYLLLKESGHLDPIASLDRVIDAFGESITSYTKEALDDSSDPFQAIVEISKDREENYFGPDFDFTRHLDTHTSYHLYITRCAYHRMFNHWAVPELTGLFCRLDEAWIRAIDPGAHRVAFSRPKTIGWGCERCEFLFDRLEADP